MSLENFAIIESTLREGEQFANAFFTSDQKVEIDRRLDAFGVEYLELTSPAASPQSLDDGAGIAGLVTSLELIERGHSVVLLDRADESRLGGLARISFGGMFIVDSPEQRRTGIRDSPDSALRDWIEYGELDESGVWPRRGGGA